jgi:hypothetical protein
LGVGAGLDEPGLLEYPKMLRNGRLAQVQVIDEVTDGTLTITEEVEDGAATGLAQDIEGGERRHHQRIPHQLYS